MGKKIREYIKKWKKCGYSTGIPDVIPHELMVLQLAPSYKSIAIAILKNDHSLKTLGFIQKESIWYHTLKKIEIDSREVNKNKDIQLELF